MRSVKKLLNDYLPQSARAHLKRGLFHVRNRGFQPYVAHFERYGRRFQFYVGDRIGEAWFQGGWDQGEISYVCEHMVEQGDVILECGAHHGELTILLSHSVGPQGKVLAFEPVPRNMEILQRQIELNDLSNVELVHAAVGREPGWVRITDESNAQVLAAGPGVEVPVVSLDDYVHLQPTLLKIDVEGFEAELLKGAQEVLALKPKVALEIHTPSLGRYGTSVEEVLELVRWESYDWWKQYQGEQEVSPWRGEPIEQAVHFFGRPKEATEGSAPLL